MEDFPIFRRNMTERAIEENSRLATLRKKLLKRAPIYGFEFKKKEALVKVRQILKQIAKKQDSLVIWEEHEQKSKIESRLNSAANSVAIKNDSFE